jgi:hypothetical protein
MPQPSLIADYLDALARELSFDPALSLRVRKEARDHLLQAAASELGVPRREAERRAVANFGDAHELARQYAASSLLAQTRRLAVMIVFALAGVFVAMKGRVAWYGLVQWDLNEDLRIINAIAVPVDRYAFMAALATAIVACGYIVTRQAPTAFHRAYGRELHRCAVLCAAAASALGLSVVIETILTGLRLSAVEFSPSALVPALSMAAEIAFAGVLVLHIHAGIRRTALASSLLRS